MRAPGPDHTPLTGQFRITVRPVATGPKRPAPFSIRLSADERQRLSEEAGVKPLGTHIREKLLGGDVSARVRRTGATIYDREAHARALALLGSSRLSENLAQLADLARDGALPFTPEIEAELRAALGDLRDIRRLLVTALGLKNGGVR
jgi:hypothetical protein